MLGTRRSARHHAGRQDVWAVNLSPEHALYEYGEMVLKVGALASAIFDSPCPRAAGALKSAQTRRPVETAVRRITGKQDNFA